MTVCIIHAVHYHNSESWKANRDQTSNDPTLPLIMVEFTVVAQVCHSCCEGVCPKK